MWRKYFKLVKLVPGKVIVQGFGTIDFSGDVAVETCKKLYENDFEYLEITEDGKRELYGVHPPKPEVKSTEPEKQPVKRKRTYKKRNSTAG